MSGDDLRAGCSNFDFAGFECMLLDEDRNHKYQRAIETAIKRRLAAGEEAHFLDIGSGTGLLSLFAARAGATTVTAIEVCCLRRVDKLLEARSKLQLDPVVCDIARSIAADAGFADRIKFLNVEATTLDELPGQRANVLASEIVDSELLGEGMLLTLQHAITHLVTNDVICIPARADAFIVPVQSETLRDHCSLPAPLRHPCNATLGGIDGQWTRSDDAACCSAQCDVVAASPPQRLCSFDFNAHTIIPLERSFKLEFAMAADEVDQVDGVLLSWDLDLLGDSSLVITTRDECKQVGGCQSIKAYGFVEPIFLRSDDQIVLVASHDAFSFFFELELDASPSIRDPESMAVALRRRVECSCGWHQTLSPDTIARWHDYDGTLLEHTSYVAHDKKSLVLGEHSLLSTALAAVASTLIVVDADRRFQRKISELREAARGGCTLRCVDRLDDLNDDQQPEIEAIVFDLQSRADVSPIDFALPYATARRHWPAAVCVPETLELRMIPVHFDQLWRRKQLIGSIDGFDYSAFDDRFMSIDSYSDTDLEALPLWEEQCRATGADRLVLSFTSINVSRPHSQLECAIPLHTDAFVFYMHATHFGRHYENYERADDGETLKWRVGSRAWVHFVRDTAAQTLLVDIEHANDVGRPSLSIHTTS